jgi:ABC-type Fe3+/spermidine/putrescine transport system ATPase subunit
MTIPTGQRTGEDIRIALPTASPNGEVTITVRPEKIKVVTSEPADGSYARGTVLENVYLGSMTQLIVEIRSGERLIVHQLNDEDGREPLAPGAAVILAWSAEHSYVIPEKGPQ